MSDKLTKDEAIEEVAETFGCIDEDFEAEFWQASCKRMCPEPERVECVTRKVLLILDRLIPANDELIEKVEKIKPIDGYSEKEIILCLLGKRHTHVAGEESIDKCRLCGKDIRDEIHLRMTKPKDQPEGEGE